MTDKPSILLIGNDPSLEYLLQRYADRSGYRLKSIHSIASNPDIFKMQPISIWFSSLDMLEASQSQKDIILSCNVPIVVCSSIADDARAMDLGADYLLLHPLTYDHFLSTLDQV
jgi:DNA-binding response OmpR family regulator